MTRRAPRDESGLETKVDSIHEDVRQLALQLRGHFRMDTPARPLAEISAEWLPRKLAKIEAPETFEGRVRLHLLPALGEHTHATLLPIHIEDMMAAMTKAGYGAQTANHVRDAGRQLVNHAIKNRAWLGGNPFDEAPKLKIQDPDHDVLTAPEAGTLLRFVVARYRPLFALALYLGPRRGTIINIRPEDLHLDRGTVDFLKMKDRKPRRDVPIPEELAPYMEQAARETGSEWLFTQKNGKKMCAGSHVLCDELANAFERAGIRRGRSAPRITFHGLRRCSSTLHQEAGCHPWVVSKILGHSQKSLADFGNVVENMTAKRYTQFSEQFVRRELSRLSLKLPKSE